MNRTVSIATITMLLAFMFAASAYADSIGLSYSQVIDDKSFGLTGDYQSQVSDRVSFEADMQVQAGDIYKAKLQTDFIFDISTVDLKLLIENKAKGYNLNDLGREQSVGLAFTLPVDNLNFNVGIGGKNASPFGAPNAYDTLVGEGFAESDLAGKGLDTVTAAGTGIPFKNGSTVNAFITTGFPLGIFDVDVKGVIELVGEGDQMHQVNTRLKTNSALGPIQVTTAIEIGLAFYGDLIYREVATVTTASIEF